MTESELHKFIKLEVAKALKKKGYKVQTEYQTEEGRIDVYAEKNGNKLHLEIVNTNLSDWILVKLGLKKKQLKKQIWLPTELVDIAKKYANEKNLRIEYVYSEIFRRGLVEMKLIPEGVVFT